MIQSPDDVQIYEEVVTDDLGVITTGFLNRWYDKKDNRIPPRGFRWDSMYVQAPYDVAPKGEALADPQYTRPDPATPLDGDDEITYEVALPSALRKQATAVTLDVDARGQVVYDFDGEERYESDHGANLQPRGLAIGITQNVVVEPVLFVPHSVRSQLIHGLCNP